MSKKAIMLGIYAINLIVFFVCSMLWFCMYPIDTVEKNKTTVTVKWKQALDHDAYIDTLYEIADEISGDLMLRNMTEDYQFQYFRTENDPDFIELDGMDPGQQYATDPQNGEQKIKGFFFLTDSSFQIAPLRLLKGTDTDLSIQEFLISDEKVNDFSKAAAAHGLELSTERGVGDAADFSFLYRALAALAFFLIVSIVFYAFSRSKDMIVKKTMGFSDLNIAAAEMKENASMLLLITAVIFLLAFTLFSVFAGVPSTLLYLKKSIAQVLLYLLGTVLLFMAFIFLISAQCSISSSKGKSFNKQLFVFTAAFKTVTIIFLGIAMTELFHYAGQVYTMYHTIKKTADLVDGYAETEMNARLEDSDKLPEKYAPIFLSFYREMHDSHNFIIAKFTDLFWDLQEGKATAKTYHVTVNDNYLDTFDTIYGTDGKPIHSDALVKGKLNFLIPEHYDPAEILKRYTKDGRYSEEEFHFIRCSDSSKYFTFSNLAQNGYVSGSRIIAEVFDPELFCSRESAMSSCAMLGSCFSSGGFYTYDTASDQDPYYQILPIIKKTGMDKVFISSPSVMQDFMNDLKRYKSDIVMTLVQLLVILFAFVVIVVYGAELDYKIYAKDYSVKCVTGFSFFDIFILRILCKLIILPVLVALPNVSLTVALCCALSELVIYIVCMKRRIGRNTVTILKGE